MPYDVRDLRALFQQRLPTYALGPAVLCLAIGLWGIDEVGLWDDERHTLFAIPQILWRLWEAPLIPYYASMWIWTGGGAVSSDAWLRFSSVLAMTGAVFLTSVTAKRLGGRRVGLLAGLTLALMPSATRYAQEARVYAFATLLAALATWLVVRGAQGGGRRWWVAYALTLVTIGVLAPFAYAIVPAHGFLILQKSEWRPHLRAWAAAGLTNIPILIIAALLSARFGPNLRDWLAKPTLTDLVTDIPDIAGSLAVGVVLVALSIATRTGTRWLVATAIGMAALWLVSIGPASFWLTRSFLPLAPVLAVAASFIAVRLSLPRFLTLTALLGLLVWPSLQADRQPGSRGLDPRQLAGLVDSRAEAGDVVNTAISDWLAWGVSRYSSQPDVYQYAPSSTGRAWVLDKDVPCVRLEEYTVPGGDSLLVLCQRLPEGWENRVVRN